MDEAFRWPMRRPSGRYPGRRGPASRNGKEDEIRTDTGLIHDDDHAAGLPQDTGTLRCQELGSCTWIPVAGTAIQLGEDYLRSTRHIKFAGSGIIHILSWASSWSILFRPASYCFVLWLHGWTTHCGILSCIIQ
ncbi:predicted protein [Aspergillus nidulans FGSC A4]|uniref:Uncharacterized protein n=1 Tax=Emericella nidulans (strain FGSC A4 / ATCC 38163 / CBS 112.46 / NRRL 194 / M139) TaxID=227321 RepID=Q5BEB7_EMENI|nr:hypothetical protein [Aspergillus nidulans FGSC A4]EAA66231.1 predicted protein [Aspergillus nidulans FGSC A4]CBF88113.1 TPA: conserved hypothetical protein [Aspergillus nidulans FGSC A4]|eukprot:XP_658717.1 predicted protein [Aspergillus nidulans FGSC A4]